MVDVSNITNYERTYYELEELMLFWVLAAGKNGRVAAANLEKMLAFLRHEYGYLSPFCLIKSFGFYDLPDLLKSFGIGCYRLKSKTLWGLVNLDIDLRSCSCYDLEQVKGIGKKSSRGFILHTRRNARYAVIDRHLLRYLSDLGYKVPRSTPSNDAVYHAVEQLFLTLVPFGMNISEFDLLIWRTYSGN
jgi:hypothetical protein